MSPAPATRPPRRSWKALSVRARVAALLAAALTLRGFPTQACRCPQPSPREALQRSHAAFVGRVVAAQPDANARGFGRVAYEVRVDRAWRGVAAGARVVVRSVATTCRYPLRVDTDYLIFARRAGDHWTVDMCSGTQPLREARAAVRALGAPR